MLEASDRVVVRSDTNKNVLFSVYKVLYPYANGNEERFIDHHHAELEITCIQKGKGIYHCGEKEYPFSPGDVFFIRSNDIHFFKSFDPKSGETPELVAIRFDPRFIWSPGGEWFDRKYLQLFIQKDSIRRNIPHDEVLAKTISVLLSEIFDECHQQRASYDLIVKAKLMTILANMARYYSDELTLKQAAPINDHLLEQMARSTSYILSHITEPLTLEALAKEACMSRSYYSTMFKALNGLSVWDYIIKQRVDLSQYQLETTNETILQISENCGFNSVANFNRAFKKLTGVTPSEYRKENSRLKE